MTSSILAKPLALNELSLKEADCATIDLAKAAPESEARLMEMLAAQAAHSAGVVFDQDEVDAIASSKTMSEQEKRAALQKAFVMAASNGNVDLVNRITTGEASEYVDINAPDDEGTPALIYASCFVSPTVSRMGDKKCGRRS